MRYPLAVATAALIISGCSVDNPVGVSAPEQVTVASARASAPTERLFNPGTDDWEPTVGTDPAAPYVYVVTTRYGSPACPKKCPDPALVIRVSNDGGATFGPDRYLCVCRGGPAQNDPQVSVARDGTVYAAWLNDFVPGVVFSRSTDHGRTWSAPMALMGALDFSDKPILAISPSGKDVYVAFNASDSYIVSSHDHGRTFGAPVRTNADNRYWFADGGYVAPDGTVTFTEASYTQTSTGPVFIHTIQSEDGGRSWTATQIDAVAEQPDCTSEGCPLEFLGPSVGLGGSGSNRLVMTYNGAVNPKEPQRIFVRRSSDGGRSWSARTELSRAPTSANGAFPAAVGGDDGDFRVWYMDDRAGPGQWNVWFRQSDDDGRTWSAETRLSDAAGGAPYKSAAGFGHPYGDYGGIAITSAGATFATWGEGTSYTGPGGTWMSRLATAADAVAP